jgi:uncharacterized protein
MNKLSEGKKFLGSGISFPFRTDGQGRLAMNHLEDQIRQSIMLILQTARGERVMRPEFGAGLSDLAFAPVTFASSALAENAVKEALMRFEPRVEVLTVKATYNPRPEGDSLYIDLDYRVRQTDSVFNLVYPFYLERGER